MKTYIIRRLFLTIPILFILSILVFLSVRFIPGDVIDVLMVQQYGESVVDRELLERRLGLDVPAYVQYGRWIGGIFRLGTLGTSLLGRYAVEAKIVATLPVTIELGVMAIVIGLLIALPVGVYSAIRQDTAADYLGRSIAIIGLATPNFWLALLVMTYPALWWGWAPSMRMIPFTVDSGTESWHVHHSRRDCGDGHGCIHHAHDPHHDAGSAPAGLYQDGLVKGS